MNKIITLLLMVVCGIAQDTAVVDTTWQKEVIGSLSFSQAHFDNGPRAGRIHWRINLI